MTKSTHYIVQSAAQSMPGSCWGKYGRIAVLEVDAGLESVSMISERAKGVHRIVETWEKLHIGKTERCAFDRAFFQAQDLCDSLNEEKNNG